MLIVLHPGATAAELERLREVLASLGAEARPVEGPVGRQALVVSAAIAPADGARLTSLPGVDEVIWGGPHHHLASRDWHPEPTRIRFANGVTVGGDDVIVIAGPCAVEGEAQLLETAHRVAESGAQFLRGGAFKPRTSPWSFQGLGPAGLELLERARQETGLLVVTEALDPDTVDQVAQVADVIQIGSRNMANPPLLKRVAQTGRPVLLKRGMAATLQELLLAAEYLLAEGNGNVILCERGVRGFDGSTRNVLDLAAIPLLHQLSHLPVIADPSHGTGRRSLVPAMARAALAAGADGVMVEVHPDPDLAHSDGEQSMLLEDFPALMRELHGVARAVGRRVAPGLGVRT
ncbi:MAG TPA: 3-deoxy-7-phosphoheptulonate synthase [Gemmatimonadales bacterium]